MFKEGIAISDRPSSPPPVNVLGKKGGMGQMVWNLQSSNVQMRTSLTVSMSRSSTPKNCADCSRPFSLLKDFSLFLFPFFCLEFHAREQAKASTEIAPNRSKFVLTYYFTSCESDWTLMEHNETLPFSDGKSYSNMIYRPTFLFEKNIGFTAR